MEVVNTKVVPKSTRNVCPFISFMTVHMTQIDALLIEDKLEQQIKAKWSEASPQNECSKESDGRQCPSPGLIKRFESRIF